MNSRERFHAIASFERTDDPFIFGIGLWKDTFRRWVREGMPVKLFDERQNLLANPTTFFTNRVNNDVDGHFFFFDGSAEYKLSKLNRIIAASIGTWLRRAAAGSSNSCAAARRATHRL